MAANPLQGLQNTFTDALFREEDASPNIVIVGIDEATLEEQGRLNTWPRALHASVVDHLTEAGARVIAFDILFGDPSDEDAPLARAIEDAGNVVLPAVGSSPAVSDDDSVYVYTEFSLPAPSLRGSAAALAHANIETGDDGRVRRLPLYADDIDRERLPSLALATFALQFGTDAAIANGAQSDSLALVGREVPLEEYGTMRINYVGASNRFTFIPFSEVLSGGFDEATVDGKAVFVGMTAPAADRHSAPLLEDAAGVEIHANALDTLFRARFLEPAPGWVALLTGAAFAVSAAYTIPRWYIPLGVLLTVALVAIYGVASAFMFYQGTILNTVDPPAALLLASVVGLASRVLAERAAQREVEELFGRYVSDDVARELMERADRGTLELGGAVREVTVLFGDIRGFTSISEGMDPAELVEMLNRHFNVAVSCILEREGIVNKYIGDAIMAFWNAPREQVDHALLASQAAIDACERLSSIAAELGVDVRFGFGITTGPALVGNVGAAGRLEYTVIGETVNTASRLSGAAGGGEVWISERTCELIAPHIETERLPPQRLKGMSETVNAYRIKRSVMRPLEAVGS